ncbi:MAG: hypothetical protein EOM66_07735 [Clostridia bacterium]|nr:hypothetical protein [Clostridia bacterium]
MRFETYKQGRKFFALSAAQFASAFYMVHSRVDLVGVAFLAGFIHLVVFRRFGPLGFHDVPSYGGNRLGCRL